MLNRKYLLAAALTSASLAALSMPKAAWADATAPCNVGQGTNSTECGVNSSAGDDSTAVGDGAIAEVIQAVAVGSKTRVTALNALTGQFGGRLTSLEEGQAALFDLANINRTEARRGIAAASALVSAPMPSEPGKTSLVAGTAFYRGEGAFSVSFNHRLNVEAPVSLGGGIAHSGGKDTVVRAHIATEF